MALAPGLRSFVRMVVADTDTAMAMGSGDVPVRGTARLIALAEAAAVAAIRPSLEPGQTSVGTSAVLEHKRPSPLGAEVVVEAGLTEVDGGGCVQVHGPAHAAPRITDDHVVVIGAGTLERVLVDRDRFVSRAQHE